MNRDQIRLLAQESGFVFYDAGHGPEVLHTEPHPYSQKCFERFANLVIAHHRETIVSRAKSYMAYARSAAGHHFNRWHQASEHHLARYSGMDDLLDAVLSKQ